MSNGSHESDALVFFGATGDIAFKQIFPALFALAVEGLVQSNCAARIVVEKPFGSDLASAQKLNQMLQRSFPESSIFRIDHFLS